jgi:hypothetical protein
MALMIVGYSTTLYCCTYRLVFRIEVVRWVSYLITTDLTSAELCGLKLEIPNTTNLTRTVDMRCVILTIVLTAQLMR